MLIYRSQVLKREEQDCEYKHAAYQHQLLWEGYYPGVLVGLLYMGRIAAEKIEPLTGHLLCFELECTSLKERKRNQ